MKDKDSVTRAIIERYKDAYLHAKAIIGFGAVVKIVAAVLGIIIVIAGTSAGSGTFLFLSSIISGFTAGAIVYFIGVNIAAQGQILQAILDSAVNSSPFLENEERARIMSLPLETSRRATRVAPTVDGSEIGVAKEQATRREAANQAALPNSDQCELCGRQYSSRYYFVNNGEASRLLCLECEKRLSDDQIVDFMQGGNPEWPP